MPRGPWARAALVCGPDTVDARRWHSEQPNVTGRGIVAGYSARFWAMIAVLGALTGLGAAGLMKLLRLVSHLAYGYHHGPF